MHRRARKAWQHPRFRPHHTVAALSAVLAVTIAATALFGTARIGDTVDRGDAVARHRAAEQASAELIEAFEYKTILSIRLVQGFAVAPPEEISVDLQRYQDSVAAHEDALRAVRARISDVVDAALLDAVTAALEDYDAHTLGSFADFELGPDTATSMIAALREAGNPWDRAHAAMEDLHGAVAIATDAQVSAARTDIERARLQLLGATAAALLLTAVIGTSLTVRVRRLDSAMVRSEQERARQAQRDELEARLSRGLAMASTEEAVFQVVEPALGEAVRAAGTGGEVLVADATTAPFKRAVTTGDAPGCGVPSPQRCAAARRGQTLVFETSTALEVCPHLTGRPEGACSAACVPVSAGGTTVGVIHATGPDGAPPAGDALADLEVVGRRVSERLTMLRAYAHTGPGHPDTAAVLPDRHTIDEQVRKLVDSGTPYSVACGHLDTSPADERGADGGARAQRVLAAVLRESLRPDDLAIRHGGNGFLVVLPGCEAGEARNALERVRERLAVALATVGDAPASLSLGHATSDEGDGFDAVVEAAEEARRASVPERPGDGPPSPGPLPGRTRADDGWSTPRT